MAAIQAKRNQTTAEREKARADAIAKAKADKKKKEDTKTKAKVRFIRLFRICADGGCSLLVVPRLPLPRCRSNR